MYDGSGAHARRTAGRREVEGRSWSRYFAIINPQIRNIDDCIRLRIITRYGLLGSDAWLWWYACPGGQIRPMTLSRESGWSLLEQVLCHY